MTTLLNRCEQALDCARRSGADHAEAFGQAGRSISVSVEKNDVQISRSLQETMIGIRAFVGRRVGFACTNDPESLAAACADAVTLAKASPPDDHNVLPAPASFAPAEGTFDPAAEQFGVSEAVRYATEFISIAQAIDRRVILGEGQFAAEVGERVVVNSDGLSAGERASLFSYFALATAQDGEVVSNMDFQFGASRSVAGIETGPIVERACRNALGSLGATKGETFVGPVILSPNAVQSILVQLLLFQLNAKNVLRGMSRWKDAVGQATAVPFLTVSDDGLIPEGVATSAFDREGTPHRPMTLIDEGVVRGFLHNAYTANAMGARNTGHAAGSARSLPAIGPTNFSIAPGDHSKDEMIAEIDRGLLVTRFSGTADPVSGDFSGVAKAAYLIVDGRIERPVTETLIAGNSFEAIRSLSAVSSEREPIFAFMLPYVRLEGISVTGG